MPSGQPPAGGEPPPEGRLRISEALAAAARNAEDPQRIPEALCAACVRLLPVSGASVAISGGWGVSVTWCASDHTAARLAELQYTVGDGPCQTALEQGAPVLAADLTDGRDPRRWPIFANLAVGLGVRAVFSLPLGVSGATIGTLDLYCDQVGGLSEPDLRMALWARDAITYALISLQPAPDSPHDAAEDDVASWMEASEADHTEVYQAVGMVMVQLNVDPEQALDRLRAHAFGEGRTVSQVARDVLNRKIRFEPEPSDPPEPPEQPDPESAPRPGPTADADPDSGPDPDPNPIPDQDPAPDPRADGRDSRHRGDHGSDDEGQGER